MSETEKPAPPPAPVRDQADPVAPPGSLYTTGETADVGVRTPGLSHSPGLMEVPDSKVPGMADGTMISHVYGPGQTPVDPIAAGLDTGFNPASRAENRSITQTGELAAGPRPSTYAQHGGHVPQAGPSDGSEVKPPSDADAAKAPGPNSVLPSTTVTKTPTEDPHAE
jgi:hypothetical protein